MADQVQFREKLAGILKLCKEKRNKIDKGEVEEFFRGEQLSDGQMELVFDYLLSQKIVVLGYVKSGGNVTAGSHAGEAKQGAGLSREEEQYLKAYEADLKHMPKDEPLSALLLQVVETAKKMERREVFLGDLIQEGNMGMMLAKEAGEKDDARLLQAATEYMQSFLESQTEMKRQDKKIADKVNSLDESIKKLTEEMGRKVSVDELVEFLGTTEEEILDVLRLAGEE